MSRLIGVARTASAVAIPSLGSLLLARTLAVAPDPRDAALGLVALNLVSFFVGAAQAVLAEQWQLHRRAGHAWGAVTGAVCALPVGCVVVMGVLAAADVAGGRRMFAAGAVFGAVSCVQAICRQRALVAGLDYRAAVVEGVGLALLVTVLGLGSLFGDGWPAWALLLAPLPSAALSVVLYRLLARPAAATGLPGPRNRGLWLEFAAVSVVSQLVVLFLATTPAIYDVAALRYFNTLAAPVFLLAGVLRIHAYRSAAGSSAGFPWLPVMLPAAVAATAVLMALLAPSARRILTGSLDEQLLRLAPLLLAYLLASLINGAFTLFRRRAGYAAKSAWLRPVVEIAAGLGAVIAVAGGYSGLAVQTWLVIFALASVSALLVAVTVARRDNGARLPAAVSGVAAP